MSKLASPGDALTSADRPRLALTLGDVAGIGPEVAVRAALDSRVRAIAEPILYGHPAIVQRVTEQFHPSVEVREIDGEADVASTNTRVDERPVVLVRRTGSDSAVDVPPGVIDPRAGLAAYEALVAAIDASMFGKIDAIVTAPLHKESLRLAGIQHPGHTEILAERCGVKSHAMMLHLPQGEMIGQQFGLSVAHVTLHTSIASVPGLLSVDRIRETIVLIDDFVRQLGCERPRIGVCSLNPHAGEHGLFGDEEGYVIEPAVAAELAKGRDVRGPLPADTLVRSAIVDQRYDGLVAMYHEQGHIPFKLIGFDRAVNVTLGLPIVRTSPSHGTAFDIAWQGIARAEGMCGAILTAVQLARFRRKLAASAR